MCWEKAEEGFPLLTPTREVGKKHVSTDGQIIQKRLEKVVNRLRDIRVESVDGIEFLREFSNRPATLVYIDPPYLAKRSAGYAVDVEDKEFHIELLERANISKCMILISGYNSEIYNDLLTEKKWMDKDNSRNID